MTKPAPSVRPSRGLVNPEVAPSERMAPNASPAQKTAPSRFRTHIPEPRWQRVVSVVVVAAFIALELWFWLRHR